MGILYTTYFSNLENLPDDIVKYIISRNNPDVGVIKNIRIARILSPSDTVYYEYKKSYNWRKYVIKYCNELKNNERAIKFINELIDRLNNGEDICLVCYERNFKRCHRYILAKIFMRKNIKWKEFNSRKE